MTWLKYKFVIVVAAIVLAVVGMATIALAQSQQPTVYSFLEKPPIISTATFEREINMKNMPATIPAGAQKQTFTISLDGEDYRMDFGGGMAGRFGQLYWQIIGGQLIRFDTRFNRQDGNSGGIVQGGTVARMGINSLVSAGITTASIKHIEWQNGNQKAAFDADDGNKYTVEFVEENGHLVLATVHTVHDAETGWADGIVAYHYDPQFCEGQFPVEITRYFGDRMDEKEKAFIIRIKSLEVSRDHLASSILDPGKFMMTNKNYTSLFYSNNILYWAAAKGEVQRVLTAKENAAEIEKIRNHQHTTMKGQSRLLVWLWFGIVLIAIGGGVVAIARRKRI
jgi:hypothetical protein